MFKGSIVAIITPFTPEGEVDYEAFKELVDWHVAEGTNAIIAILQQAENSRTK